LKRLSICEGLKLLGVVFKGDRHIALERFADPTPGPHQVVVEIKASGMT